MADDSTAKHWELSGDWWWNADDRSGGQLKSVIWCNLPERIGKFGNLEASQKGSPCVEVREGVCMKTNANCLHALRFLRPLWFIPIRFFCVSRPGITDAMPSNLPHT